MAEARESWYQNAEQVTITLFAKNVEAKSVEPTLVDERTLEVAMRLPAAYRRRWRLYGAVVAPCAVAVTAYKVELTLRKAAPLEWPALEAELGGTEEATAADSATILRRPNTHDGSVHCYPSSRPQSRHINWQELIKKEEEDDAKNGGAGIDELFRKLYSDADEDSRRAMIKSYQTSGGTVLSTNWKEVAERDYAKEMLEKQKA